MVDKYPKYEILNVEYQKGSIIGKLQPGNKFVQNGESGKIVILNKYQKFNHLKQGMIINKALIQIITQKSKFCVANIINGEYTDHKNQTKPIK